MSVTNGERLVTKQDLADFYNDIRPYMGGIVTSKAGFTPIGTIISVMGTTAPINYLACDGTVYNIADYVELANYFNEQFGSKNFFGGNGTTTFAVPDLRGEFLRGTGTNSHANQGSGANVGVHQDGTEIPRSYGYMSSSMDTVGIAGALSDTSSITLKKADSEQEISGGTNIYANGTKQTTTAYIYTSRPTNTSVLYCIATKNFYIDPTLDYSTEEKIVGTWIDEKPLYQQTLNFVPTTGDVSQTFNHGISDVDTIMYDLSASFVACEVNGVKQSWSFSSNNINLNATTYAASGFYFTPSRITPTDFQYLIGTDLLNRTIKVILTVRYTKTD